MDKLSIIRFVIPTFAFVALASKQFGQMFTRFKLPLISGFLAAGMLAGPFVLNLIPAQAIPNLLFIDEISLSFIAFAAGSELFIKELKGRLKSISWVTLGLVVSTLGFGTIAIYLLADFIPFMREMSSISQLSVSLLAATILVARSPSSAIAIVNELRAKGPFTQTVMGVIIITDVVVIMLFGFSSSVADALLTNVNFSFGFILLLLLELILSLLLGYGLGKVMELVMSIRVNAVVKSGLILATGYGVFLFSAAFRSYTHEHLPFEILIEPLLVCMIGSFVVTNFSSHRDELMSIFRLIAPPIYVAFFTLTGASLAIDILLQTWTIALAIFLVRLLSIFIGAYSGGVIAKDPAKHSQLSWMTYVTQAGVGLGLAKEVAFEFPDWGMPFATVIIAVIVLNQIIGPPLFKWAINRVGESHTRAQSAPFDGVRDAIIFGLRPDSVNLARQLARHNWQVKLVCVNHFELEELISPDLQIEHIDDFSLETLERLDAGRADAMVSFLDDESSYQLCESFYEHFGIQTMAVLLRDRANFERFHQLGVLIVEPQTAALSLLEHFVRSPAGTSLLLGMDDSQEVIDVEVNDPSLHDTALRDLRLPLDVLVLGIQRAGHTLVVRGYTTLHLGDRVTMVGPEEQLEKVALLFEV